MESLHVTEFASKRYFEKINQLPKDQQQQNASPLVEASSSKFILPIRYVEKQGHDPQSKHADHIKAEREKEGEKEKERRRLFGLGRLRSPKSSVSVSESHIPQTLRRPSTASAVPAISVGECAGVRTRRYGYYCPINTTHSSVLTRSLAYRSISFS